MKKVKTFCKSSGAIYCFYCKVKNKNDKLNLKYLSLNSNKLYCYTDIQIFDNIIILMIAILKKLFVQGYQS